MGMLHAVNRNDAEARMAGRDGQITEPTDSHVDD
jgi:hypothetical protein